MLNTIQEQILKASIQNRNDNESVSRDMFEVAKKIAMDYDGYVAALTYSEAAILDQLSAEERFEVFIEQYNPQP